MPEVTQDQALELLTKAVREQLPADEVLEVYNELFPTHPYAEAEAKKDPSRLVEELVAHIHSGLEVGELMELWRLILTRDRNLWYDEVEEKIHYNEETETLPFE
jgi:hypothetical protein